MLGTRSQSRKGQRIPETPEAQVVPALNATFSEIKTERTGRTRHQEHLESNPEEAGRRSQPTTGVAKDSIQGVGPTIFSPGVRDQRKWTQITLQDCARRHKKASQSPAEADMGTLPRKKMGGPATPRGVILEDQIWDRHVEVPKLIVAFKRAAELDIDLITRVRLRIGLAPFIISQLEAVTQKLQTMGEKGAARLRVVKGVTDAYDTAWQAQEAALGMQGKRPALYHALCSYLSIASSVYISSAEDTALSMAVTAAAKLHSPQRVVHEEELLAWFAFVLVDAGWLVMKLYDDSSADPMTSPEDVPWEERVEAYGRATEHLKAVLDVGDPQLQYIAQNLPSVQNINADATTVQWAADWAKSLDKAWTVEEDLEDVPDTYAVLQDVLQQFEDLPLYKDLLPPGSLHSADPPAPASAAAASAGAAKLPADAPPPAPSVVKSESSAGGLPTANRKNKKAGGNKGRNAAQRKRDKTETEDAQQDAKRIKLDPAKPATETRVPEEAEQHKHEQQQQQPAKTKKDKHHQALDPAEDTMPVTLVAGVTMEALGSGRERVGQLPEETTLKLTFLRDVTRQLRQLPAKKRPGKVKVKCVVRADKLVEIMETKTPPKNAFNGVLLEAICKPLTKNFWERIDEDARLTVLRGRRHLLIEHTAEEMELAELVQRQRDNPAADTDAARRMEEELQAAIKRAKDAADTRIDRIANMIQQEEEQEEDVVDDTEDDDEDSD